MSKIRWLSLRGIRNFGEDDENALRFTCPLTLILGPNGTGKTTIIEALKYATTGEFPPDTNKGKSFIQDPMLATTGSMRGLVKAQIINAEGNKYTVSRTIELQRTSKKFKTLDTTLTTETKETGEKISITNRCVDIDAEVSVALGVSKSILNCVIFCHQDEFNWPLDQGQVLKNRFDDIFDSHKFNKALESIRKLYKELQGDIRSLTAEKQTFSVLVSEVKLKESDLEEQKKRLQSTEEKIKDLDKNLESLKEKIEEMELFNAEYKLIQAEEEKKKMEYNMHKEQYVKLRENINNIFDGTMEELKARIESYDTTLKEKNKEILEHKIEIEGTSEVETGISKSLAMRRETVGTLKQQVKDHEKRIVRRNQLLDDALQACGFDIVGPDVTEIEIKAFMKRLEQKINALDQEVEDSRLAMQKREKELQNEVDTLRSNHSKVESEKLMKEKEITEIRDEIIIVRDQIAQIDAKGNKLKSLEQQLQAAKQRIEDLGKTFDVDAAKADIENNIKSRDELEVSLSTIDDEISALHKLSSLTAELDLNKSALQTKEKELENLKEKHGDDINKLLNTQKLPQTKLMNSLQRVQQQLEKETKSLMQEIQAQERKSTALETTVRHMESDIEKRRKELEQDKQKISMVCDYNDFDATLLMQTKKIKDLQDQRGIYAYQATVYKEYIKKLSVKDPCCPVCHRNFEETEKVTDLIKEMESDVIHNQPDRLKKCEEELKIEQEKYDNLLQLKPVVEKVIQCEKNDMKKLEEKLDKTKNNLTLTKTCIKDLETSKAEPEEKLSLLKNIIGDIQFWDRCIDEIQNLNKIVSSLLEQISNAGVQTPERTMEETQAQREVLNASFKKTRNYIEALKLKLNKHNERLQDAREIYNGLHEEKLQINSDIQKLKELKDKEKDLYTREVSMVEAVERLEKDMAAAKDQLNFETIQLEKIKEENWQKQEEGRKSMAENVRRLSDLRVIIDKVDSFIKNKIPDKLARYERKVETYETSLTQLMNKKKEVEQMINELKDDITREEIVRRELLDNIRLRKTKEMVETLKEQCKQLNEKLNSLNYSEMKRKWERLDNEKQTVLRQRNITMGNKEELERIIKKYTQELEKEEYRLARHNYTNKCIELEVQENTIADLKAYSKALDTAMIDYHEERMTTVNRIIKKLWKYVYKGSDTSSIAIRTEATEVSNTDRRSYNYKVIQTKHGCEMDMKGRCSAGQRVLASIIIRLALAETFCKDCGILALDEPTTNLDEENANSLADMLTKVVKLRSKYQKNFQLIIISHDEKFLQKLAYLNNNKRFYELYRKQNGMTAIKFSNFNEPADALVNVKDEDESEDEVQEAHYSKGSGSGSSVPNMSGRKRFNWDDFNEGGGPTKKSFNK